MAKYHEERNWPPFFSNEVLLNLRFEYGTRLGLLNSTYTLAENRN